MRLALRMAARGLGATSPNPPVGAVLYRGTQILGRGYHKRAGAPHAEIEAISDARRRGHKITGAALAVTLEPCSTHGRTPPCCEAIISEKISRVVIGCKDPNPAHAGRGLKILEHSGVKVISGLYEDDCRFMIRCFARHITTTRPWVIAKIATSLDMRISPAPGKQRTISGPISLRHAHRLRLLSDAILVGAETLRTDDPALTIRFVRKPVHKQQPWRIVLTRSGNLPPKSRLFTDEHNQRTLVFQNTPWPELLENLGMLGVQCLLIEGGGITLASALEAGVVDEIHHIICPELIGGPVHAFPSFKYLSQDDAKYGPIPEKSARQKWLHQRESKRVPAKVSIRKLGCDILIHSLINKP